MIVVISGVDGAGKSTVVSNLVECYSSKVRVEYVSAGKPQGPFLETLRRWVRRDGYKHVGTKPTSQRQREKNRILKDAIPSLLLAWMRLSLSKRSRRLADSEVLVISDRWPTLEYGKMDGPKIALDVTGFKGRILRLLAGVESAIYRQIEPADVVFYLVVDEETAIQRNAERVKEGKETTEDIIRRHRQNIDFHPIAHQVERIENNGTLEEVLSVLQARIEARL
ncbi:hypothetical protein [Halomonas mongoliensis]|uniref:hypothetical protein n=1 Tax=Halomonas mongoliensis TaxID=321265 RepID=UPI00403ADE5F